MSRPGLRWGAHRQPRCHPPHEGRRVHRYWTVCHRRERSRTGLGYPGRAEHLFFPRIFFPTCTWDRLGGSLAATGASEPISASSISWKHWLPQGLPLGHCPEESRQGIYGTSASGSLGFPPPFTPAIGASFNVVKTRNPAGFAPDVSIPYLQDVRAALGMTFSVADIFFLNAAYTFDAREFLGNEPSRSLPTLSDHAQAERDWREDSRPGRD